MNGKLRNMATIYIRKDNKMLMLYRIGSKVVDECFCGVGGHFKEKEVNDARAAVIREMKEEIRLTEKDLDNFSLRYVGLRNVKEELRINYYFFADLKESAKLTMKCNEGILQWIPFDKLMEKEMPVTAKYCVEHYLSEGMNNDNLYVITVNGDTTSVITLGET